MDNIQELYTILKDFSITCNVKTIKIYLIFFKPFIEKLLTDPANYTIYISTPDKNVGLYQSIWPQNTRIKYIQDTVIPTNIPVNTNAVYIFHQKYSPSATEQLALMEYIKNHPSIKYIYAGITAKILPIVSMAVFRHYLHFQVRRRRWGGMNTDRMVERNIGRQVSRRYYADYVRKQKAATCTMYDYLIYHDVAMAKSKIYRFNKQIYKKKKPKKPVAVIDEITGEPFIPDNLKTSDKPKIVTKYIYTNEHTDKNNLIMPYGVTENYNAIVNKYANVIEI